MGGRKAVRVAPGDGVYVPSPLSGSCFWVWVLSGCVSRCFCWVWVWVAFGLESHWVWVRLSLGVDLVGSDSDGVWVWLSLGLGLGPIGSDSDGFLFDQTHISTRFTLISFLFLF